MNVLDGPSIANLCDYDFGDQAGCLGGVPDAFMEDANNKNKNLNVYVLRPLLNISKQDLSYITKNTFKFNIEDPSNNNDDFLRINISVKNTTSENIMMYSRL